MIKKTPKKRRLLHRLTNAQFAKYNQVFIDACRMADVYPSAREASKFRRGKGKAFQSLEK